MLCSDVSCAPCGLVLRLGSSRIVNCCVSLYWCEITCDNPDKQGRKEGGMKGGREGGREGLANEGCVDLFEGG